MLTDRSYRVDRDPYRARVKVTTPPVNKPITLQELKDHLRITSNDEDAYLTMLLDVAIDSAEQYTGRKFITQELTQLMDYAPAAEPWWDGVVEGPAIFATALPRTYDLMWPPLQSVTEIATYDRDGSRSVFLASKYWVSANDPNIWGRITLKHGETWPTALRRVDSLETVFKAGYGDNASDVPVAIRQGILVMAAYLYENRGDCPLAGGCGCVEMAGAGPTLDTYRVRFV